MGEYAFRNSDGQHIKIGTCENMYYIRYEDRFKVRPDEYSLDCSKETGLIWRLPFPEEDHLKPGEYEPFVYCVLGHIPFDDLKFWDSCWSLVGIINTETGLKAALKGSRLPCMTYSADISEIIDFVKDAGLKERLLKYQEEN